MDEVRTAAVVNTPAEPINSGRLAAENVLAEVPSCGRAKRVARSENAAKATGYVRIADGLLDETAVMTVRAGTAVSPR